MILTAVFVLTLVCLVLPLHAQHTISNQFETNCNISFQTAENNVLFEMNIIDIQNSGLDQILSNDDTLKKSIFYWLHLRIFQLIDSSYLYDVDKYTSNLWNEYCLQIISVSNDYKTMTLNMNIVMQQTQIKQVIINMLKTNHQEMSAFIRFKLTDFITNYYAEITINDLYVDLILISPTTTEGSLIVYEKASNKKTYILIIGVCILIVIISGLCYKQIMTRITNIKDLVFIGQKLNMQHQNHELVSKPISIKSFSDVSDITDVKNLPNQIDDKKNNSPEIPVMNINIFNKPLPLPLQNCPSTESFSNMIPLPQKEQSKSSIDVCQNKLKNQIFYDYNGNIANIKHKKRKRTTIDNTQQSKNSNSPTITHKQKSNTICYDDNAEIGTFKIIDSAEIGNSWFNY